jgi:hypothetical protein
MGIIFVILGAVTTVIGVVMVASGVPVREFSFGNTLIVAGTVAGVGGLIVVAVGAAILQLRQIAESLQARLPASGRGNDLSEMLASGGRSVTPPARAPLPPKMKPTEPSERGFDPPVFGTDAEEGSRNPFAPMTREESPVPAELEDAPPPPLSRAPSFAPPAMQSAPSRQAGLAPAPPPRQGGFAQRPGEPPFDAFAEPAPSAMPSAPMLPKMDPPNLPPPRPEPRDGGWRAPPPQPPRSPEPKAQDAKGFDTMWSGQRAPKPPIAKPPGSPPMPPRPEMPPVETRQPDMLPRAEPQMRPETQAAAILKSGIVDGMGYTLYVDGSIEAELPQGTVRFASIADLRSHLEKSPSSPS